MTGDEKVDLRGGSSGKLVAVMGDVIGLGVMCNVVAGGSGKRVCKRVKRYEPGWENATDIRLDELYEVSVVCETLGVCVGLSK